VDSDWGGAKRGTVGAVEQPFVTKDVTERASGRQGGWEGTGAVRASRARGLGQPEGRFCCHEQRAIAVSGDGGEVLCECITAVLEHCNEDNQSDFVNWVACEGAADGGTEAVDAVQQE
jgi:hypothetical protein